MLYFGPGIETEEKKEFWHGDLWAESPLFGQEKIAVNRGTFALLLYYKLISSCSSFYISLYLVVFRSNKFVMYKENGSQRFGRIRSIILVDGELQIKLQRIYTYNELPNYFHCNARSITSESQLWLVDQYLEEGSIIIYTYEIIRKVDITIVRESNIIDKIFIKEILYKNNGHWKLRNVNLDYMHPCEYSTLALPPPQYSNFQVLKLFIDLYYDDFGTYRNVYHSLSGVYVQLGNMPFDARKYLHNHFILGFIPFGGHFEDFIRPFIEDMKQLERGTLMNVQGTDYWVIAGLGCVTADLPQGNDLAGVKRHGALRGCRTCLVAKENSTDITLDIASVFHYHYITDTQFECIFTASTIKQQNDLAKEYGLRTRLPILDQLQRERHL
ncbi:hypothetical protein RhiirA5_385000 [Rhizophagus irregularis]|uniref:Uncharacterized protein n=1 Tax=Rhizophagus irregularis TaxID=588596 RepID=A0A2N0NQV3_9GLOM|nr:hypothetical protein RhiirA5_385000 [Rhizophagus irregularis]